MRRIMILGVATVLIAVPTTLAAAAVGSPSVTTGGSTATTSVASTLHGSVNPEGQSTQFAFQYGTSSRYGHETALTSVGAGTGALSVSSTIAGLLPGTRYHYRTIAISAGGTSTGSDQSFKTTGSPPAPTTPPTVATGTTSGIFPTGATVSGTVNPNGLATESYIEFGPTSAYGFQTSPVSVGSGTATQAVSATLAGLGPDQTYHYRLVAVNAGGTSLGADATFKTTTPPPGASTLRLFGQTGFVSPSGVGGVLVGCLGQSSCAGGLTLSRGGVTLGRRPIFNVGVNDGGVVHLQLNPTGQRMIGRAHHLRVNVTVTEVGGQSSAGVLTLVQFS